MAQEGSDDEWEPGAEQHETEAEDGGTEAEDEETVAEGVPAFEGREYPSHIDVDRELYYAYYKKPYQPPQQPVGSKRQRNTRLISRPSALKRPRRKPPVAQGQSIGGVARIGAGGQLRSLGKYGAGMQTSCKDCGGGPHQATVQATDADIEPFYDKCIQGQNQKQKLDEWLGKRGTHVSRGGGVGGYLSMCLWGPCFKVHQCLCSRNGIAPAL